MPTGATSTPSQATLSREMRMTALRQRLSGHSDGIAEVLAKEFGVSTRDVVEALPHEQRTLVSASAFEIVFADLTSWGEVLFIVHTPDIVLECAGSIPPGSSSRGYFNIHGDSPIGGHIKAEHCSRIAFVARPFMGRPSRSIQFFNTAGEAMFKIFVRRDAERNLKADQVERFDALRARLDT
jgi:heme iron utilization protein